MGYYRNYRRPKPETIPVSEELTARLERVAVELKPHLTDWEQGFMESITEAYKKWSGLTVGQHRTFEKIEKKYDPETLASKSAWADSFDDEKRKVLNLITQYYKGNGYFKGLVAKIESDPSFVPCETTWKKFVENKYAQKVLAAKSRESKFEAGGFALLRDTFTRTGPGVWSSAALATVMPRDLRDRKGRTVLVLKQSERLSTDKVWTCCFLDDPMNQWEVEERWLKKHRMPKKQKEM